MRIGILVDSYPPRNVTSATKMMHELAICFLENGHEVTVVTPDNDLRFFQYKSDFIDGVSVVKFGCGKIKNVGLVRRGINESLMPLLAWITLRKVFHKWKIDHIVYLTPSIFWGMLVKWLKKRNSNIKSFLVLRDIFPQWAVDIGLLKDSSIITDYFRYFEKENYAAADVIGMESEKNLEFFSKNEEIMKKSFLFPNWITDGAISKPATPSFRERYKLQDKVLFVYGGNMGHAQDMLNLVRLVNNLRSYEDAFFLFIGSGDQQQMVRDKIRELALTNLLCLDPVPQAEYDALLTEVDVGLFTLSAEIQTSNFPGKLLGYFRNSIPVLGSVNKNNDTIKIIGGSNSGLMSVNGDDEMFKNNAIRFIKDPALRRKCGENARLLYQKDYTTDAAYRLIMKFWK